MDKNNGKDIYDDEVDFSYIALISKKLRVGIIGGGKAGEIKARHFVNSKCYVEILSRTFDNNIIKLAECEPERLKLITDSFNFKFLEDKHLIIIALDDEELRSKIKKYCDDNYKLYIDSTCFKDGMGAVPIERNTKNITFALNTKQGNPKGTILLSNKVKNFLEEYDEFIEFTGRIRDKAKKVPQYKKDILEFIGDEDFKDSFDKGESESALRTKFSKEIAEYLLDFK
ncbi:NAD(P)-dependent oxidoreductase [Clostridium sp. BL-8]|uniref:NAD(P)-dependent oxidoreductase n=1 Tax=Clostridium sp. BL-8 TaxID=349938 RepID=UPI00098C4415|nr:NAD(P)-dependent oxidoreductase [Clostridium sp. BL-8]OOM80404.1 siroheme synthase [Clostridium sp. BL-8]